MRFMGGSTTTLAFLLCGSHVAYCQRYSPSADQSYTIETDLQSLLHDTTISQEKELSETLAWYQKLPSEGSCVQLAAMKLMSECKLLDNPSEFAQAHPDLYLDDVKVEYAVKLANCEIVGAQPDQPHPPQHCELFVPSPEACIKRSWNIWGRNQQQQQPPPHLPCYPQATDNDLHRCLKTLRSSPQYWTSFSNAKFRAVNMCQLSRHAIERERTLQLHKNLTHVTFRLHAALRGVQNDFEAFHAKFKQSTDDVKHNTDQFRQFAEEAHREAQRDRAQVKHEMQAVQVEMSTVHDMVISNISTYNSRFDEAMASSIARAITAITQGQTDAFSSISAELESFYKTLKADGSQLAVAMNEEIQQHHEKALLALQIQHGTMMQSYAVMSDSLDDATHKVENMNEKVDALENKTDKSLTKIDVLDGRLDGLRTKFKAVERAFKVLDAFIRLAIICAAATAILVGICMVCIAGKTFRGTSYIIAILASGGLLFVLDSYNIVENFRAPDSFLTIGSSFPITRYMQASPGKSWAVLAAICFFAAAVLPKMNSFCEGSRECMAALPNTIYERLHSSYIQSITSSKADLNPPLPIHNTPFNDNTSTPRRSAIILRMPNMHEDDTLRTRVESFQRAQSVA